MNKNLLYGSIFVAGLGVGIATQYLPNNKLGKIKEDITAKITADSIANAQRSDIIYNKDVVFRDALEGYLGENHFVYEMNEYTDRLTINQINGNTYSRIMDLSSGAINMHIKTKNDDLFVLINSDNKDPISVITGKKLNAQEKELVENSNELFDFFEGYVNFKLRSR